MAEAAKILEHYDFNHKYRGIALIIMNKTFDDPKNFPTRYGASRDIKMMRGLFKALDFKLKVYKNLTAEKIMKKIERYSSEYKCNKESDCFVCVLGSHGSEIEEKKHYPALVWNHVIYGRDGVGIEINSITAMFSDDQCRGLAGKPKMFFIQACRSRFDNTSTKYDLGDLINVIQTKTKKINNGTDTSDSVLNEAGEPVTSTPVGYLDQEDSPGDGSQPATYAGDAELGSMTLQDDDTFEDIYADWIEETDDDELKEDEMDSDDTGDEDDVDLEESGGAPDTGIMPITPYDVVPVKCPMDCLIMYPVMPGKIAFSNQRTGSWMLQYMYQNCPRLLHGANLLSYLTSVCGKMARYNYDPEPNYPKSFTPELIQHLPFKTTACIVHRLTADVGFQPKAKKSQMALQINKLLNWLKSH